MKNFKYFPKNKEELIKNIQQEIKLNGNRCNLNIINTSKIKDMSELFYGFAGKFNGDISKGDVSNVTNMSYLFSHSKFNGNISNGNVGNVTDMNSMFVRSKFNQDISKGDVSNVTNMSWTFYSSKFNQDISNGNVSKVIDMTYMFKYSNFNQDISNGFNKLNKNCNLIGFDAFNKHKINSYEDFKQYHRQMILKKLSYFENI